jgi:REP element-mobilizing transposase RayT
MSEESASESPMEAEATLRTRFLPHWERDGATYYVTFRLADALPRRVLLAYQEERETLQTKARAGGMLTPAEQERLDRLLSTRIQQYLDRGAGACHLAKPAMARVVAQALRRFDGERYRLVAWCIMPNHVHVVMQPLGTFHLSDILHTWKSFTANQAQRLLGIQGAFWQHEYYDHLVRDEDSLWRIVNYVLQNPAKANLEDWPWVEVFVPE